MTEPTPHTTRLEIFRRQKGWSYEQLGEQLGVTGVHAARLCRGERRPGRHTERILAEISDYSLNYDNFDQDPGEVAS